MNIDQYGELLIALGILAASAIVAPVFARKRKLAGWINFILTAAAGVILLNISYVSIFGQAGETSQLLRIGPVGIYLLIDGFSGFFIGIISFMAVLSAFYSIQYMEHYPEYSLAGYYINFPVFILGMIGIVTADDLSLGFSISWQLMTVASYFLIRFEYRAKGNVRNANKYLALMEFAWVLILAGTFFIPGISFGDSLHAITEKITETSGMYAYLVYGLIFIGFGFKAGMFPFGQLWLPDAHSIAPSPISALLSGVMIKTGVYGIIRTFFWMVPRSEAFHYDGLLWGAVIASFGVVTLFIGTVQSMKQSDSKRLLAYSSIGQVGYIILGTGAALYMFHTPSALAKAFAIVAVIGAVYHVLNHAVFKGLLFLSSGSVLYATGTKDLNKLGGLLTIMPVSALAAGVASLSIAGVPPFSGFASKWSIISSSLIGGSGIIFLVIFGIIALFTSAITLSCYVKFFGMTYTSVGSQWNVKKDVREVPVMMLVPKMVLTLLCVVQGLIPYFYYQTIVSIFKKSPGSILGEAFSNLSIGREFSADMMGVSVQIPGMNHVSSVAVPLVVALVIIAAFLFSWLFKRSGGAKETVSVTWLCGYQDINNLNRYRDQNMFMALKRMLRWTGGNVKNSDSR
jgi:hydrogenase-4 component B